MFHKILVALDSVSVDSPLFNQALTLAQANQASLMLLHVLPPMDNDYPGDLYIGAPRIIGQSYLKRWQEREQEGINQLRALEEQSTALGIETEFTQNLGDAGRVICKLAQTWNADLILIGRRGLSGLSEAVLGSVSNYVLHHAPCHVLVVQRELSEVPKMEHHTEESTV